MKILSKIYLKASNIFDQSLYRFWCSEVKNAFLSLQARHGDEKTTHLNCFEVGWLVVWGLTAL